MRWRNKKSTKRQENKKTNPNIDVVVGDDGIQSGCNSRNLLSEAFRMILAQLWIVRVVARISGELDLHPWLKWLLLDESPMLLTSHRNSILTRTWLLFLSRCFCVPKQQRSSELEESQEVTTHCKQPPSQQLDRRSILILKTQELLFWRSTIWFKKKNEIYLFWRKRITIPVSRSSKNCSTTKNLSSSWNPSRSRSGIKCKNVIKQIRNSSRRKNCSKRRGCFWSGKSNLWKTCQIVQS